MRVPSCEIVAFDRLATFERAWSENVADASSIVRASIPGFSNARINSRDYIANVETNKREGDFPTPSYNLNCIWKNNCSGSGRLNEFTSPYVGANGTEKYLFSGTPLAATSFGLDPL